MSIHWIYLLIAGLLEIVWAVGLKSTQGFTRPVPSAFVISILIVSFIFLSQAVKGLPIGTAYAVWTGIGAAGTAIVGIIFLHEPFSLLRAFCIFLIVAGVTGLKLFSH